MSDPLAKAERSKAKDARQSPAPDKAVGPRKKNKGKKPWRVLRQLPHGGYFYKAGEWYLCGRFQTRQQAEESMQAQIKHARLYKWSKDSIFKIEGPE